MRKALQSILSLLVLVAAALLVLRPSGLVAGPLTRWLSERPLHAKWKTLVATGIRQGSSSPDALQIVEFTDYQCPFCRKAHAEVAQLLAEHPNVTLIYQPFPLPMHFWAREAAIASVCAAEQGEFTQLDRFLFENPGWATEGRPRWDRIASAAGVKNPTELTSCMSSTKASAKVDSAIAIGRSIGIAGTPTFATVDGFFHGLATKEKLERALHVGPTAR